jgi:predicted house-cleaning noncanonical NTP pyrophosphatase (MazG superfamily)
MNTFTNSKLLQSLTFHAHNDANNADISKTMQDFNRELSGLSGYAFSLQYLNTVTDFLTENITVSQTEENAEQMAWFLNGIGSIKTQIKMVKAKIEEIKENTQHTKSLVSFRPGC